jgi:hypothetical protein
MNQFSIEDKLEYSHQEKYVANSLFLTHPGNLYSPYFSSSVLVFSAFPAPSAFNVAAIMGTAPLPDMRTPLHLAIF